MATYKTTGDFMLIDPQTRTVFDPGVETEVESVTAFIKERLKKGDLVEVKAEAAPAPAPAKKKAGK